MSPLLTFLGEDVLSKRISTLEWLVMIMQTAEGGWINHLQAVLGFSIPNNRSDEKLLGLPQAIYCVIVRKRLSAVVDMIAPRRDSSLPCDWWHSYKRVVIFVNENSELSDKQKLQSGHWQLALGWRPDLASLVNIEWLLAIIFPHILSALTLVFSNHQAWFSYDTRPSTGTPLSIN